MAVTAQMIDTEFYRLRCMLLKLEGALPEGDPRIFQVRKAISLATKSVSLAKSAFEMHKA